jgi:hypothetical protein
MTSFRSSNGGFSLALAIAALSACSVNDVLFTQGDGAADARIDGSLSARVTLQVTSAQLALVEGRAGSVGVSLSERPASAVTITLSPGDAAKLGVSPAQLTISPDDFATPRMVTISALEDADAADEQIQLAVTAPGLSAISVSVAVDDNDGLAVVTSPAAGIEVTEGLSETLAVRLSAQPTANVTATLTTSGAAGVAPAALTFTPANWDVEQMVTVSGRDDANTTDDTVTLAITGTGVADLDLPVKVFDDDVLGIVPSLTYLGALVDRGRQRAVLRAERARCVAGVPRVHALDMEHPPDRHDHCASRCRRGGRQRRRHADVCGANRAQRGHERHRQRRTKDHRHRRLGERHRRPDRDARRAPGISAGGRHHGNGRERCLGDRRGLAGRAGLLAEQLRSAAAGDARGRVRP